MKTWPPDPGILDTVAPSPQVRAKRCHPRMLGPSTTSATLLIGPGRTPSGSTGISSIIIANVAALAALVARRALRDLASI
jgi:hypothetical protein